MRRFIKILLGRILIVLIVVAACFAIKLNDGYYWYLPEGTAYNKIPWIYRTASDGKLDERYEIFLGSSICKSAIDDRLMTEMDSTGKVYLNFGVNHSCNALTEIVLERLIKTWKNKPGKIYLCLKTDARPVNIHQMYPIVAHADEILESALEGNTQAAGSFFRHASWNIYAATKTWKMDTFDDSLVQRSPWGLSTSHKIDTAYVLSLEKSGKQATQNLMEFVNTVNGAGSKASMMRKLSQLKMRVWDNMDFQDISFLNTAQKLDAAEIPYDVVLYPNFAVTRFNGQRSVESHYYTLYPEIDWTQHKIIALQSEDLKKPQYWEDLNHLNEEGARIFSSALKRYLDRSSSQHSQ
jgi:hypothetical protein